MLQSPSLYNGPGKGKIVFQFLKFSLLKCLIAPKIFLQSAERSGRIGEKCFKEKNIVLAC